MYEPLSRFISLEEAIFITRHGFSMKIALRSFLVIAIFAWLLVLLYQQAFASYSSCDYQLTFSDNFNAAGLDTTKWDTAYPSGNSGEQQYYAPDAFTIQNGVLDITAEKRSMSGYPYTSGIITTQGTFSQQYGYFSMRAKLPKGQGYWPAFWLLPAQPDYPTEIDIFELLGKDPTTIYMSNHWRDATEAHQKNIISFQGPDFSSDFHTFSLFWTSQVLIWYVDGVEQYRTTDGIPNQPMFLLANLAIGGKWPGNTDQTTTFPGIMQIDYINVYQVQCPTGLSALINKLEAFINGTIHGSTTTGQPNRQ